MANLETGWTVQIGGRTYTEVEVRSTGPVKEAKNLDPNEFEFVLPDDGEVFDNINFTDQVILRYDGAERLHGTVTTKKLSQNGGAASSVQVKGLDNWVQVFWRATRDEAYLATDPADIIRRAIGTRVNASEPFDDATHVPTVAQTIVSGGELRLTGSPGSYPTAGTMRATSQNYAPGGQDVTGVTLQADDRLGGASVAQDREFVDASFTDAGNTTLYLDPVLELIRLASVGTDKAYPFSDDTDTLLTTGAAVVSGGNLTLAGSILSQDFEGTPPFSNVVKAALSTYEVLGAGHGTSMRVRQKDGSLTGTGTWTLQNGGSPSYPVAPSGKREFGVGVLVNCSATPSFGNPTGAWYKHSAAFSFPNSASECAGALVFTPNSLPGRVSVFMVAATNGNGSGEVHVGYNANGSVFLESMTPGDVVTTLTSATGLVVVGNAYKLTWRISGGSGTLKLNASTVASGAISPGALVGAVDPSVTLGHSGRFGIIKGGAAPNFDVYALHYWRTGAGFSTPSQSAVDGVFGPNGSTPTGTEVAFSSFSTGGANSVSLDVPTTLGTVTFSFYRSVFGAASFSVGNAFVFRTLESGSVEYYSVGGVWTALPTPLSFSTGWNTVALRWNTQNASPSLWTCGVTINGFDGGTITGGFTTPVVAFVGLGASAGTLALDYSFDFGVDDFAGWAGSGTGPSLTGTWTSKELSDTNVHHALKLVTTQATPGSSTIAWTVSRDGGLSYQSLALATFLGVAKTSATVRLRATMTAPDYANLPTVNLATLTRYFTYESGSKKWQSQSLGASFKPTQMRVDLIDAAGNVAKTQLANTTLQIDVSPDNYGNVQTISDGGIATFTPAGLGAADWRVRFLFSSTDQKDSPTISAFRLTMTPDGGGQTVVYKVSRDGVNFYTVTKGVPFTGFGGGDNPKNQLYFRVDFTNADANSTPEVFLLTMSATIASDLVGVVEGTITNYGTLVNFESFAELRSSLIQRIEDLTGIQVHRRFNPATGNVEVDWNEASAPATITLRQADVRDLSWTKSVDRQANRIIYSGGQS